MRTDRFIRGDVDLEAVFSRVAGSSHENVIEATESTARDPVELHSAQIDVRQLLQQIHGLRPLNRDLCVVVGQILYCAVELASIVTDPVEVLLASAGVDHE